MQVLERRMEPLRKAVDELNTANQSKLSELFNNLKMIKLYGWDKLFVQKIKDKRDEEIVASDRRNFF
jgi:hypothetical protein